MMNKKTDSGLSDAIGAIVLVAVVGMGIALVGIFILSQPAPEKIPALTADITTIGRIVLIEHNGGDSMYKDDMAIIVDGGDLKDSFVKLDGAPWSSWAVGDSLLYRVPDGDAMPEGVTIFYIGGSSARIIQSMGVPQSVSAGGLYPTGTVTPTPTVTPGGPVVADFGASPMTGLAPLSVQFIDASTGPVTSWAWNFGDTGTSALQNPLHQYAFPGDYTVSLTVGDGTGTDTEMKTGYITVSEYAPGLLANYYSDQSWSVPAVTKIATRIRYADTEGQAAGYASDLASWPADYVGKTEDFSVSFDGYLLITTEDDYTFYLTSDDGSWLWIDGGLVIDNGGVHPPREYSATVHLTQGYHPIRVRMFENTGQAVVHLEYSTPSVARVFVTDLYHMPETPPLSDFTATPRASGSAPLIVQFTDTSIDASSWSWNFGDGSPVSYLQNPQHPYEAGGLYTVALTTTNVHGSNTATKTDYIVIGSLDPGLLASYYYGQTWTNLAGSRVDNRIWFADAASGYPTDEVNWPSSMVSRQEDFSLSWDGFLHVPAGDTYTFYLTSDDGSWLWIDEELVIDNGGLHSPTEVSETVPLAAGYRSIRVRMFENTGDAVAHLEYSTPTVPRTPVTDLWHVPTTPVTPAPVAGFTAIPLTGTAPLTVQFTDTSANTPTSWSWDFGDGDATNSTVQTPVHTYAAAGTYTVSLTATNAGGSDTLTRAGYIVAGAGAAPVRAGFTVTPLIGISPLAVQFADSSTGPVTSRSWTFGDGSTSTQQNPLYTYPAMGRYTVSLAVSNGTGSDTLTRTNYVTVGAPVAGTITLNRPTGPAYIEPGSTLQFRVQPGWAEFTLDGTQQVLAPGNIVQLVWGSDGYGSTSSTATSINSMLDFTDVSVYVNGALIGRGTLNSIYIASCDQYQSTMVLTMPPSADWTGLTVDGSAVPVSATDTVSIYSLGSAMNLNAQAGSIWYSGGASSYIVY